MTSASTPAVAAREKNFSAPKASTELRYVSSTKGTPALCAAASPRTSSGVTPAVSAVWVDRCTTGPSAMGSENGMPSSTMSAPASIRVAIRRSLVGTSGWPPVR